MRSTVVFGQQNSRATAAEAFLPLLYEAATIMGGVVPTKSLTP